MTQLFKMCHFGMGNGVRSLFAFFVASQAQKKLGRFAAAGASPFNSSTVPYQSSPTHFNISQAPLRNFIPSLHDHLRSTRTTHSPRLHHQAASFERPLLFTVSY